MTYSGERYDIYPAEFFGVGDPEGPYPVELGPVNDEVGGIFVGYDSAAAMHALRRAAEAAEAAGTA